MLTNISWTTYLTVVAITLGIYYLYVGFRFYSAEIKALLSGNRKLSFRTSSDEHFATADFSGSPTHYADDDSSFEAKSDDEFAEVEELIERLKSVIADAAAKKADPKEFRNYLHLVLKEYQNIKKSPLRSSINELIASECEKYTAVALSEDEVDVLWDDAV